MSKSDRYSDSEQLDNSGGGGMFTGHDGPATMNNYWSVIRLADQWEVLSLTVNIKTAWHMGQKILIWAGGFSYILAQLPTEKKSEFHTL